MGESASTPPCLQLTLTQLLAFVTASAISFPIATSLYCGVPFMADFAMGSGWLVGSSNCLIALGFSDEAALKMAVGIPTAIVTIALIFCLAITHRTIAISLCGMISFGVLAWSIYMDGACSVMSHMPFAAPVCFAAIIVGASVLRSSMRKNRSRTPYMVALEIPLWVLVGYLVISAQSWHERLQKSLAEFDSWLS